MREPFVKIFAGCDPNDCDLEQMMVLEHSVRKRSSLPVEIEWMRLSRDPASHWYSDPSRGEGWRTERWATPFSGFRWGVPSRCGYEGRAIYMDTDMLVLGDIAELWTMPMPAPAVFAARTDLDMPRYCVMLWDCAAAREILPDVEQLRARPEAHREMTRWCAEHRERVQAMDPAFNNIDGEDGPADAIKILHYSDMGTQFTHERTFARLHAEGRSHWFDGKVMRHPRSDLAALFEAEYQDALAAGRSPDDYRAQPIFGDFPKKSERRHKGNPVTRPAFSWRRLFGH
ncbi:glycosyl transferase [Solimonas marina]|uniref:Glycosyl transferase n=1 Tax=Solimonas marina TaxID=2714601 RepID=A0A969WBP7_9GAMM|nr:glycosyl transferase [Solimonas marina]NKF23608.1 glycosyl transferase [Solimonas marina]